MSFACYPDYKDSGVEWLGKVPGHWKTLPLSRTASKTESLFIDGDWIESKDLSDDGIRYLTSGNVGDGYYKEQGQGYISEETFTALTCVEVIPGDVLISRLNLPIGRSCLVPDLGGRIVTCVDNVIVRPDTDFDRRFFVYQLTSKSHFANMENLARGTTMQRISRSVLGRVRFAFPPLPEQTQIAAFLDRETAKIDELVAEQRRLMALLKEKRQAVISHAVTQGLNPDAPLKSSGIEWLGDVPAHWDVKPMRMIANVVRGASPRPAGDPRYFGGEAVPWVTVGEITKDGSVYLTETEFFLTDEGATHSNLFKSGTLIYSNSGATLGVPKVLSIDACANDGVVAFLNLDNRVQAEFLYHYLASITDSIREKVKQGSGQPNLNTDIVKDLRFGLPPLPEQELIVAGITELANEFDTLTTEAQRAIDLLVERRTALISAAVTGQIDVRSAALEELA